MKWNEQGFFSWQIWILIYETWFSRFFFLAGLVKNRHSGIIHKQFLNKLDMIISPTTFKICAFRLQTTPFSLHISKDLCACCTSMLSKWNLSKIWDMSSFLLLILKLLTTRFHMSELKNFSASSDDTITANRIPIFRFWCYHLGHGRTLIYSLVMPTIFKFKFIFKTMSGWVSVWVFKQWWNKNLLKLHLYFISLLRS